jgi:hypothetical protein
MRKFLLSTMELRLFLSMRHFLKILLIGWMSINGLDSLPGKGGAER